MKTKRDRTSFHSLKNEGNWKTFSEKKGEELAIPKLSQKELFKDIIVVCYIGGPSESGIPVFFEQSPPCECELLL